jgi:hypothetical protein
MKPFVVVGGKDWLMSLVGKGISLARGIDEPRQDEGNLW